MDFLSEKGKKFLEDRISEGESKKRKAFNAMKEHCPDLLYQLEQINNHPDNKTKPRILEFIVDGIMVYSERE